MEESTYQPQARRWPMLEQAASSLQSASTSPRHTWWRALRREVSFKILDSQPRSKAVAEEAAQARSLPSCCPQLDFSATADSFHVSWHGKGLDLKRDPGRKALHPLEVAAASKLRLTCTDYHIAKHKIVAKFREHNSMRKEFRKTNAQRVGGIDARKASELWAAFVNAGWFRSEA